MNRKREKRIIDSLPFDCWCEVILYFDSFGDLQSLILTVKGLWEYVKRINSNCLRNVVFDCRTFLINQQTHVKNLQVVNFYDRFIKDSGLSQFGDYLNGPFLGEISEKFSSLETLRLDLVTGRPYQRLKKKSLEEISSKNQFSQLRNFSLLFHLKDLGFKGLVLNENSFPKMEVLHVHAESSHVDYTYPIIYTEIEKFKYLRVLKLINLVVGNNEYLAKVKDSIEEIEVTLNEGKDFFVDDYPRLRKLKLCSGIEGTLTIQNLPSLIQLEVRNRSSETDPILFLRNLPMLSDLKLMEWATDENDGNVDIPEFDSICKQLKVFHSDDVLLKQFDKGGLSSLFQNSVEVIIYDYWTDKEQEVVDVDDWKFVRFLKLAPSDIILKSLTDCPVLEELVFIPDSNCVLRNLPLLRKVKFEQTLDDFEKNRLEEEMILSSSFFESLVQFQTIEILEFEYVKILRGFGDRHVGEEREEEFDFGRFKNLKSFRGKNVTGVIKVLDYNINSFIISNESGYDRGVKVKIENKKKGRKEFDELVISSPIRDLLKIEITDCRVGGIDIEASNHHVYDDYVCKSTLLLSLIDSPLNFILFSPNPGVSSLDV